MQIRIAVSVALALGAIAGAALTPFVPASRADNAVENVTIDNFTFAPHRLTVKRGTTVTWINRDDIPHTVTAVDLQFRSKALDSDDSYSFTFTAPGTYAYFCSLHPRMTGTIVVEAAASGPAR
jgi:amicyanin